VTIEQTSQSREIAFNEADEQMLAYLGLDPRKPADRAAVTVAQHYGLDPLLRHVIVIPGGGVYITRDGLLHLAHRSGHLDGIVVDQPPTLDRDANEWVAVVTVYRNDQSHGYRFPGRYPVGGKNKQYAPEMALKAAEAHALRRAFAVTGLPTEDEHRPEQAPRSGLAAVQATQTGEEGQAAPYAGPPSGYLVKPSERGTSDPSSPPPVAPPLDVEDEPYTYAESEPLNVKSNLAKALFKKVADAGIPKDKAHDFMSETLGRTVESSKDLTVGDARRLLRHLPSQEA
jgi:hypothetical protein